MRKPTRMQVLRVRVYWRWLGVRSWLFKWTVCAVRGHDLGQIEPIYYDGWSFRRPCKRCRVEIGCEYETMRGIYEYEPQHRHNGRLGIDVLIEEAQQPAREGGQP